MNIQAMPKDPFSIPTIATSLVYTVTVPRRGVRSAIHTQEIHSPPEFPTAPRSPHFLSCSLLIFIPRTKRSRRINWKEHAIEDTPSQNKHL